MARRKARRSRKPKALGKRFASEPIATTKREYRKLPLPAKYAVWSIALGAVGGPVVIASMQNLPVIGPITGSLAQWGSNLKTRLMPPA